MEQLGARRAHNPKVTGSSPVPATKDDSSVFFIGESFFYPLYPLSYLRYAKIEIEFYRFDIVLKLGQSLFPLETSIFIIVINGLAKLRFNAV